MDVPEFRLLLRLLRPDLQEKDVPHKSKMRLTILENYRRAMAAIKAELSVSHSSYLLCYLYRCYYQRALGKVSLTADVWSDKQLRSYLAVTAHYLVEQDGKPVMKGNLIAFHYLVGKHDGQALAQTVVEMSDRAGITSNVCAYITPLPSCY